MIVTGQTACIGPIKEAKLIERLERIGLMTEKERLSWLMEAGVEVEKLSDITVEQFHHDIVPVLVKEETANE